MASEVGIVNQALQLLGAASITALTDADDVNAVAANLIYEDTRDSLLRSYPWKFATKRTQITANTVAPAFGRARSFNLPDDYLAPLPPYPENHDINLDWIIEGEQILTNDSSPLDFRYTSQITDPDEMDPLFRKALSAQLAVELAEQLTQSNTKLANVAAIFDEAIATARRISAFEAVNHDPPVDEWVRNRQRGRDNTKNWH